MATVIEQWPFDLGEISPHWVRGDGVGRNSFVIQIADDLTRFGSDWTCTASRTTARTDVTWDLPTTVAFASGVTTITVEGPIATTEDMYGGSFVFDISVAGGTVSPLTFAKGVLVIEEDVTP